MTISILQETSHFVGASNPSISVTFGSVITQGSSIQVFCYGSAGGLTSFSCSDDTNGSYGSAISTFRGAGNHHMTQFNLDNSASGTITVTVTPNVSATSQGIVVREIGGTLGYDNAQNSNVQSGPGTGANAITTQTMTPSVQPGLISAIIWDDTSGTNNPTTGTSPNVFSFGANPAAGLLTEQFRYTSLTALAGTGGSASGATDLFFSFGACYKEGLRIPQVGQVFAASPGIIGPV